MKSTILCAADLAESPYNLMKTLLDCMEVGFQKVVFLHVIEREKVAFVPYGGYLKDEENRLREIAFTYFDNLIKKLSKKGVMAEARIEIGIPVAQILRTVERAEEKIGLIVAGRRKKAKTIALLEGIYGKSTIANLIRRSPVPVLLVNKEEEIFKSKIAEVFEHVVLATDWSPPANRACNYLLNFKNLIKQLDIIHVISENITTSTLQNFKKKLEETYMFLKNQGIETETYFYTGKAAEQIIQAAERHKATTIAIGTTRKKGIKELLLGSPSYWVAEFAEVPTLVVP
ncbi:MAG: universal stress protein [Candidatus Desulfofervidaceae bacterium]|nr:universal stress protein [Candidatus Desulfofervidaceae bacterium]